MGMHGTAVTSGYMLVYIQWAGVRRKLAASQGPHKPTATQSVTKWPALATVPNVSSCRQLLNWRCGLAKAHTVLGKHQLGKLLGAWTADSAGRVVPAFHPNSPIHATSHL